MKQLANLYLFIHAVPRHETTRREYMAKWERLFMAAGPHEENVLCIITDEAKETNQLINLARTHFGERCIVDPDDHSVATQLLLAEDLQKTLAGRGMYNEWVPYEIWTSHNARRWSEGLKQSLEKLGYTYASESLHLVTCGQEWGGCLTKYSMFMGKYLGLMQTPDLRADLSPDAGFPLKATYKERIALDQHVYLFLFELPDGRPMAQFMDGLRAVWEAPHLAIIPMEAGVEAPWIDQGKVEVITTSPNLYLKVDEAARVTENTIIADVGDGCHPATTTLIANPARMGYAGFRASLASARITCRNNRSFAGFAVGYLNPITTSREDE
ncbi:MAG: hypothetical protein EXR62_11725 [Chloroflexi bacterium]|nr:hypothetical protein [Chloroflexota bacterium]